MTSRKRKTNRKRKGGSKKPFNRDSTDSGFIPAGYSTPVINNYSFPNPFHGVPVEDRVRLISDISDAAAGRLKEHEQQLFCRIKNLEPRQLLATASMYSLHRPIADEADFTKDGPYPQAVVEVLQSACLAIPKDDFGSHPTLYRDLFPLLEIAKSSIEDLNLKEWSVDDCLNEASSAHQLACQGAKAHTRGVRNWGYPQHMRLILTELFEPLESDFAKCVGVSVRGLLCLFDRVTSVVSSRATELLKEFRPIFRKKSVPEMVTAWAELIGANAGSEELTQEFLAAKKASTDQVRTLISQYIHQFYSDIYSFTIDQLLILCTSTAAREAVGRIIERLSFRFGDLANLPFEHLLTQSPIRLRPFIKLGESAYFIPIPGLTNSFCMEIVESLIDKDSVLWGRYLDRRFKFLESKVSRAMSAAFPNSLVEPNLQWKDDDAGKSYEVDTLVVVGPIALVCEAKSNRVSDSARRGGPERLKRDFGSLIDKASEQATRTAKMLEGSDCDVQFVKKDGTVIAVAAANIRRAVCISISLDYLPSVTLCWKLLTDAGLVKMEHRPTISLTLADLIVVLEVLAEPAIRLHYFWRRSECEERAIYFGDEEDLLVYYLSNGFGALVSTSLTQTPPFSLAGNSEQLRRYYMSVWHGTAAKVPPPRRLLAPMWLNVIQRVQSLSTPDRWHVACSLLDVPYRDQRSLEQQFCGLVSLVRRRGKRIRRDALIVQPPGTESGSAIILFANRSRSIDERNSRIDALVTQAINELNVNRVVLLCKNGESSDRPYDSLFYWELERGWAND